MYLLDTNILIYYFNDNIPKDSSDKINIILKEHFNISVITKMEFLGFRKHSSNTFEKAKTFLDFASTYDISDDIVNLVITIRRKYSIKLPDAIIAATSVINKFTLVTRNESDFKNINLLEIFNPYK